MTSKSLKSVLDVLFPKTVYKLPKIGYNKL